MRVALSLGLLLIHFVLAADAISAQAKAKPKKKAGASTEAPARKPDVPPKPVYCHDEQKGQYSVGAIRRTDKGRMICDKSGKWVPAPVRDQDGR